MPQDTWDMQEEVDKRDRICEILGSWELLTWHSMNNNESMPQTRYRFMQQLAGIDMGPDLYDDELASDQRDEEEARRRRAQANTKAAKESAARSSGSAKRKGGASSSTKT